MSAAADAFRDLHAALGADENEFFVAEMQAEGAQHEAAPSELRRLQRKFNAHKFNFQLSIAKQAFVELAARLDDTLEVSPATVEEIENGVRQSQAQLHAIKQKKQQLREQAMQSIGDASAKLEQLTQQRASFEATLSGYSAQQAERAQHPERLYTVAQADAVIAELEAKLRDAAEAKQRLAGEVGQLEATKGEWAARIDGLERELAVLDSNLEQVNGESLESCSVAAATESASELLQIVSRLSGVSVESMDGAQLKLVQTVYWRDETNNDEQRECAYGVLVRFDESAAPALRIADVTITSEPYFECDDLIGAAKEHHDVRRFLTHLRHRVARFSQRDSQVESLSRMYSDWTFDTMFGLPEMDVLTPLPREPSLCIKWPLRIDHDYPEPACGCHIDAARLAIDAVSGTATPASLTTRQLAEMLGPLQEFAAQMNERQPMSLGKLMVCIARFVRDVSVGSSAAAETPSA